MLTGKFGVEFRSSIPRRGPFGYRQYTIIYAISAPELERIKFGKTSNVQKRFRQLCNGCPCPLELLGHVWLPEESEAALFKYMADDRCHGEWFRKTERTRGMAALIAAQRIEELAHELSMTHMLVESVPSNVSWGRWR